ncbi:TIGR00282 family metallophosphoesterase [Williamsoniiplasma luminosum]|uniref:TIGR00282 family metallophosphoesterase n=1 Tax=Williamsoniiplasma luminosum TaxID=214888 RepID=A0A2S0NL65_9MOLU|nr:TIGR00282 family metallophosphoesterase [Williamsoniiplasma luminosum]AVP49757.1 MAG: TIGR00282 family metallophosphoesterase [Williamsoniiplasma luminosum]
MKILMVGDVYGAPGRAALKEYLPNIVSKENIDFVVVNGENVTHGASITQKHYQEIKNIGVDVITSGNHIFDKDDVVHYIKNTPDLLRPLNMNIFNPGNGFVIKNFQKKKIAVVNLLGTAFMDPVNNPYEVFDQFLKENENQYDILLVDFHAEATAEKLAFAWNYDGIITGFVGTHTHVQTADERILPKGTAYITDIGMTGPRDSIIGVNPDEVVFKQKTGRPSRFQPSKNKAGFGAVVIEIDDKTNKAIDIKRILIN